jgi:hypothetical protein
MNEHHFSYPTVVPLRPAPEIVALSYELLDAHADTALLSVEDATDAEWQRHLAYLRDLQRVGRETLARG